MLNPYYKIAVNKFIYEIKYALGKKEVVPGNDDEIILNGQNVFDFYLPCFHNEEEDRFRVLTKYAVVDCVTLQKCGRIFKEHIYGMVTRRGNWASREPIVIDDVRVEEAAKNVANVFLGPERYDRVRGWLADEQSRRLYDKEILQKALKAAGWYEKSAAEAIYTGISLKEFNQKKRNAANLLKKLNFVERKRLLGLFISMADVESEIVATFLLEQYSYGDACSPREGDVFFDCGACCDDTAIWALGKVGEKGTVVAFEPIPEQVRLIRRNTARYLRKNRFNLFIEKAGLGDRTGVTCFLDMGASTQQTENGSTIGNVVRLDDFCQEHELYPDFIKMDIEGSELSALRGGGVVIKRKKPRIAVCVYHKPGEDLWKIADFIKECNPTYRLYLKKSHYFNETVLFAV